MDFSNLIDNVAEHEAVIQAVTAGPDTLTVTPDGDITVLWNTFLMYLRRLTAAAPP